MGTRYPRTHTYTYILLFLVAVLLLLLFHINEARICPTSFYSDSKLIGMSYKLFSRHPSCPKSHLLFF